MLVQAAGQGHVHQLNSSFGSLKVSGNIHLRLIPSESNYLGFEGDAIPENLIIEQDKDQLTLRSRTELKQSEALEFDMYLGALSELEVTRGAVVRSTEPLKQKVFALKADTGGKAEFSLECDSLNARVNQGSDIILSGKAHSLNVTTNTAGNFLGYEFEAVNVWVKATTASQVKVHVSGILQATATGKSFVGYKGLPTRKEFKTSLGGKIEPQTE